MIIGMLRVVFFVQFIIALGSVFAQNTERFYDITRRDGLASGSITSIVQDQQGLIWIGTKQGLNRYDGTEFIHFHSGNSNLASNDISTLFVDVANNLWIGTFGNGLHRLNLNTQKIEPVKNQNIGNRITSVVYISDSTLLILSNLGISQVNIYNPQDASKLLSEVSGQASAVAKVGATIWVGTNDGHLYRLDKNGTYVSFSFRDNTPGIAIQKIYALDATKLLIGTRQHGLMIFDHKDQSISDVDIDAIDIRDITKDRNGNIWIGTDGQGVYKMTGTEIFNFVHKSTLVNTLVSNAVQVCFEDRDGNLWFGTAWDGISVVDRRFENQQFYYSDFEGTDPSGVLNIYIENNNLWFGTDGSGLSVQDIDQIPTGLEQYVPSGAYVQFIKKLNGSFWIGTFQSGFFIAEDKKNGDRSHYTTDTGLSHDDVRDIVAIDDHSYLIATWGGGLNVFDKRKNEFRKLVTGQGQPKDVVTLYRLPQNKILVGTFGQGVFLFNPVDFSCIRILDHLENVVAICENELGVWFGTWGQGLHFSSAPFSNSRSVASEDLPANANIFSILSSDDGNEIWLTTAERILRITNADQVLGMPFPQQQYHLNSRSKDNAGRLYFGGTDGVISFMPEEIEPAASKEIEFIDVKILNQPINEVETSIGDQGHVILNNDQNLITFRYTTPIYPSSRDERYEVQLKPINADWINVGRERSMTFADLKPGDYEFSVRNSSSKSERSFRFRILRPWWKTWWAYTTISLVFLGLLYAFRRYSINLERIKNQLEIERIEREKDGEIGEIKQRFFVNISHEIRTPLTLIIGEIEHLVAKIGASKTVIGSLNNLRNNGNHLLQLVNELLEFGKLDTGGVRLKVAKGNFIIFCREIYLSFYNKAEHQNIIYEFEASQPEINLWYDRDQLEKVFYNLLSNAFKNTPVNGSIRFTIQLSNDYVEANIEDTGPGIPQQELKDIFKRFYQKENDIDVSRQGFGIGLSIVQEIVNLHKGSISVNSELGKGSKFIVRFKPGKDHFEESDFISGFANSDSLIGYDDRNTEKSLEEKEAFEEEIMIVEDNDDIRAFLVRTLSEQFKVQEASNGLEAYERIQKGLPDLIISDVMMPEMDGITLTRKLKRNPTTSHIPIILLTARTGTIFKKEGFETGADDYITKPFNSSVLLARIENILRARAILSNQIRNELATKPDDLNLATPDEQFLKNLVQVIQSHLDNSDLNAEVVAQNMGMSHSVVYKKIKSLTGSNLVEFIRDYRLQQASEMLRKYKFTVAEACYKVGFSDKKYFSQIFKKKFGVSPSEYAGK